MRFRRISSLDQKMTLVVSDISRYGIIMVSDSAVTRCTGGVKRVSADAYKVQYAEAANMALLFGVMRALTIEGLTAG